MELCSEYSNRDVETKCWEELTDTFSCEDNAVREKFVLMVEERGITVNIET